MLKDDVQAKVNYLPRRPGVYLFENEVRQVLYVGKALSLKDRLSSYVQPDLPKTQNLVSESNDINTIETGSEFEALLLEARLIKIHRPKYNVIFRDDKSYLYVFISTAEDFPKLFITRKPKMSDPTQWKYFDTVRGEYFGPFPSAATARSVIKLLRRIFPFCQQKKLSRPCFYSHLGLCNPCPSFIIKQPPPVANELKAKYRKNILSIAKIFRGNLSTLKQDLEREMRMAASNEDFETAQLMRDQLKQLNYISQPQSSTKEFLKNPNFYFEKQQHAGSELYEMLKHYYPELTPIHKIECYDISHYGGKWSVGSQVVFMNGVPEKQYYRRYRIKITQQKSDTAMLAEMVARRLTHLDWPFPELWVVDGGKPQVGVLKNVLSKNQLPLNVIGLAKREERVVVIDNQTLKEVGLPRRNQALQLLQQIRDEAHRFALTYHRQKRTLTDLV